MQTKVKERPIIFSGAMVRALLAGTKTQTRRVVKWPSKSPTHHISINESEQGPIASWCPYGQPGDRLWVRETSLISPKNFSDFNDYNYFDSEGNGRLVQHLATSPDREAATDLGVTKATPSIFMPRWASRILLEITAVRCERLQDISESDAVAEGVILEGKGQYRHYTGHELKWWCKTATDSYRNLWFSINGLGSWESNPWVWVVEFKRVEA